MDQYHKKKHTMKQTSHRKDKAIAKRRPTPNYKTNKYINPPKS